MNERKRQKYTDSTVVFSAGAVIYTLTELLWRGSSHWTMTLTGGVCALLIHLINMRFRSAHIALRCLMGCAVITAMEFAVGCVVNLLLCWNVWDYSSLPFNLLGQVCLLYSIMWFFLSFPAVLLSSWIDSAHRVKRCVFFE